MTGLLALMLLTDARRAARTAADGSIVPMAAQDRSLWDRVAIAAVHAEAPSDEATDWRQILTLYGMLSWLVDNPVVTLNRAVATAKVHGPAAGLALVEEAAADERLAGHYRVAGVRAHLLEQAGDLAAAKEQYLTAARATLSLPEQRYLRERAAPLG